MKHLGTKRIETERLVLRRFTVEDAPTMNKNWASDPEVSKFLTWPPHSSVEVSETVLRDWVSHYGEKEYYEWAIELKELGQPIGSIGVVSRNDDLELLQVGYCMGKAWWGRGIMTEALKALIRFFFEEVGVNRVEARHDPNNPGSGCVMRKAGMTYEGTQRQADRNNQGIVDVSWCAILKADFDERLG